MEHIKFRLIADHKRYTKNKFFLEINRNQISALYFLMYDYLILSKLNLIVILWVSTSATQDKKLKQYLTGEYN